MGVKSLSKMPREGKEVTISRNDFIAYEGVRRFGKWNMFSPDARTASGLSKKKYLDIIENYDTYYNEWHDSFDQEAFMSWLKTSKLDGSRSGTG
jgi:hypothetical protein